MAPKGRRRDAADAAAQMRQLLADHTPEAVAVLLSIMRDEDQKPELRMKAAESILDRACGKATSAQPPEAAPTPPVTVVFEGELEDWSQ